MKKRFSAFVCAVAAIVMLFSFFGFASARYSSSVTVTKPIPFARTAGTVSIYHPDWVLGYESAKDAFPFSAGGTYYIHYQISNTATVDGKTYPNEVETPFYIRVVPEISANETLCSGWNVCPYASTTPYDKDTDLNAYGPFTLGVTAQNPEYVDIGFTCSADKGVLTGIRTFQVQMFSLRSDGSVKIISRDDLRIKATDDSGNVDIKLEYYAYGSAEFISSQSMSIATGSTIDFTDTNKLNALGIKIPDGYSYAVGSSYATGEALGWARRDTFDVTSEFSITKPIQVHLVRDGFVPVELHYYNRSEPNGGSFTEIDKTSQMLQIAKGSKIDFTDSSTLSAAGITIPAGYKYIAAHCTGWTQDADHYFQDNYTAPNGAAAVLGAFEVYVAPDSVRSGLQAVFGNPDNEVLKTVTTTNAGGTASFTYNGVTCAFNAEGKITFTLADLQKMFGGYNSFEIYIKNGNNTISVGTVVVNGNSAVEVDYFRIYQNAADAVYSMGYCLANPNMQLYIKYWW